jgi:nucleoside-diphosphate-sugar epimerase
MIDILVTGASGFIGQNLLNYFHSPYFKIDTLSIRDKSDITIKNDIVIHLAGKAHDLKKVFHPNEYYQVNFGLTKKLYDAFLLSEAKKFIFISSVKAAADSVEGILNEGAKPNPQTHYGKSKLMAEEYIQSQPLPEGKYYYILRPCMIHGPGNKGNLNLLYQFVKKGIPYPFAAFNNKRSFLSVENLCFIIKEIIGHNCIESGIYNVSDDDALSTNEVVSILAGSLKVKPRLWKIPPSIIKSFAKVGDLLHLPLTTERLNKLTENYIVNNQKIKKALNKELPLTAIEGLKVTACSFSGN